MKIAVLGWGSLIWQPTNAFGHLSMVGDWQSDGPALPVEFARISADDRLTLVIVPGYPTVNPVLWVQSGCEDLDGAVANLARRETGTTPANIHSAGGQRTCGADPTVIAIVETWLDARPDLDAAVWTGLGPGKRWGAEGWGVAEARRHLTSLEGTVRQRAVEYIVNAPPQIDTPVRRALAGSL